ncbi:hypothetical protein ILUMI_13593 [Ignelater luminosus]|uniref:Uncharacterized protein n=1 Tax=Ignelater luminosus TaxID=2038154 RepID=A0A8K0CS34_IGNLU|nr:hypothetical protein ILUMI_13593 [Ignelater luminosus]
MFIFLLLINVFVYNTNSYQPTTILKGPCDQRQGITLNKVCTCKIPLYDVFCSVTPISCAYCPMPYIQEEVCILKYGILFKWRHIAPAFCQAEGELPMKTKTVKT